MACATPKDCAPCSKCPDSPNPVMPRCDIVLNDGVFTNATVVVEGGCIIEVRKGEPLLYQPDNNCAGSGEGGGGGVTLLGNPGLDGSAGTIEINTVSSLDPSAAPFVDNIGTPAHAILNIGIPRGLQGEPAPVPVGASTEDAGIHFVNGVLKEPLPPAWPPVLAIMPEPVIGAGVSLTFLKGEDGVVRPQLNVQGLIDWFTAQIEMLIAAKEAQQLQIDDLQLRVSNLEGP